MGKPTVVNEGLSLETTVVQSAQQVSCDLGDEIVVLSLRNGAYYGLDPVAARIWGLLAEARSIAAIRDALLTEFAEVDVDRCGRETLSFIQQLLQWELVDIDTLQQQRKP